MTKRYLSLIQSRDSFANSQILTVSAVLLGVWLGVTIFVMTNHEFSRDEVRALSFARAAVSPLNLLDLVKNEGHPVLWYLLLYIGR